MLGGFCYTRNMSFLRTHTKETDMAKEKKSDYDTYKDQEYTEADKVAVEFMQNNADQLGPAPVYVTEHYVLWKTAGTNLARWDGPFMELPATGIGQPNGFVLSRIVEKEA